MLVPRADSGLTGAVSLYFDEEDEDFVSYNALDAGYTLGHGDSWRHAALHAMGQVRD